MVIVVSQGDGAGGGRGISGVHDMGPGVKPVRGNGGHPPSLMTALAGFRMRILQKGGKARLDPQRFLALTPMPSFG
ncbi:MAG: hypothetical protein C0617_01680 [Desulfuromonas sp.]|nr:MAG: hypothetical protein C0617_01680 [Desulfuromonas sp.]